MALRRRFGFFASLLPSLTAGALVACGGDSPLDIIPTSTTAATPVSSQPTQSAAIPTTTSAAATPTPGGQQEYTVQEGDTLGAIAVQFGVTVDALIQANSITDPNLILPGETLIIPAPQ